MLEGMRSVQKTWVGRAFMAVIMGFIVVSFAVWGVGNVFQNYGTGKLASVGKTDISTEAFRFAYQNVLQNAQARNGGKSMTNDQARVAGIPGQVLGRLMSDAALDESVRKFGLGMSSDDIAKSIKSDPSFKGVDGKFDKARFDNAIRTVGFSEQGFVQEQRKTYLRQQIGEAVGGVVGAPKTVIDQLYAYSAEVRTIDTIRLPAASAGEIAAPTDEALKAFYEARKQGFRAPEYRKLVTLAVTPVTLARPDDVSDADAQKRYEDVKAQRYGTPEKRAVQQMVFPTLEDAKAASERIKDGTSFDDIAAERKLVAADLDLGVKSKKEIFDKAIAEAAFGLAQGGVSEPVKGAFGVALVRVNAISDEVFKPFAEVAPDLKRELAISKTGPAVQAAHDKIEESRTQGKPLSESAKAAGFEVRTVDAIDAQGRDKAGAEVIGLTDRDALLRAVFASDIGVDNDTVSTKDRGYEWFEVATIEASRQLTFEEKRKDVEAAWRAEEIGKKLQAHAGDLVKRLNAGEKMTAVADGEKLEVKPVTGIRRNAAEGLSDGERAQVFNVGTDGAGSAVGADGSRLVFQVTKSEVPALDPANPQAKRMQEALGGALSQDILTQYVQRLQNEAGVEINEAALKQLTGGDGG